MREANKASMRILMLLRILERESSAECPLPMKSLQQMLESHGIFSGRKAVGRDITALRQLGCEVVYTRRSPGGYYLCHHRLEPAEVRVLTDAVEAAPFLTQEMTDALVRKLQTMLTGQEQQALQEQIYYDPGRKMENAEIGDTITELSHAVAIKKKVMFCYHHHVLRNGAVQLDAGKTFILSPYALFWRDDHYYLAGNYEKYDAVGNYRLDRMFCVKVLAEDARPYSKLTPYMGKFDTADYLRHEFHMFGGRKEQLLLRCDRNFLDVLIDRFGEELKILTSGEDTFTAHVTACISEGFYDWLLQCGARVTVLAPASVREELRGRLNTLFQTYCAESDEAEKKPSTQDG